MEPPKCGEMVGDCPSRDARVVAALECGEQGQVRRAGALPEPRLLAPVGFAAGATGHPHLDADISRIAPRLFGQSPKLGEFGECRVARRIRIHDPAVAKRGDSLERLVHVATEPYGY